MYNFYVEVFLHPKDYHIIEVRAMEEEKDFLHFLKSIRINDLIERIPRSSAAG